MGPRNATSKILVNILDDLVVRCPKSEDGCTVTVKRGEVQDHMSIYCGYALQECNADDCELPVRRKDAETQPKETTEDLIRRGSVDERTMTMGRQRLFVANPDLSD